MFQIDLNHPIILELGKASRSVKYKKGEIIIRPYDDVKFVCIVASGIVKSYTINNHGEEFTRILYREEEVFPISWIANRPRQDVYYAAVTDCEVYQVPKELLMEQLKSSGDLSFAMLYKLVEQYTVLISRIDNLEYKYARERLAFRILVLAARFGKKQKDGSIVMPPLNQQELGSTINLTRESVSREIARFERLGYVKSEKGKITVLDTASLSKELGGSLPASFEEELTA